MGWSKVTRISVRPGSTPPSPDAGVVAATWGPAADTGAGKPPIASKSMKTIRIVRNSAVSFRMSRPRVPNPVHAANGPDVLLLAFLWNRRRHGKGKACGYAADAGTVGPKRARS